MPHVQDPFRISSPQWMTGGGRAPSPKLPCKIPFMARSSGKTTERTPKSANASEEGFVSNSVAEPEFAGTTLFKCSDTYENVQVK